MNYTVFRTLPDFLLQLSQGRGVFCDALLIDWLSAEASPFLTIPKKLSILKCYNQYTNAKIFAATTVISPDTAMARPEIAPSVSPSSIAFDVPIA